MISRCPLDRITSHSTQAEQREQYRHTNLSKAQVRCVQTEMFVLIAAWPEVVVVGSRGTDFSFVVA